MKIPIAELYDCLDRGNLSYEDPAEAVSELLDDSHENGVSIADCIAKVSPIELHCYNRRTVTNDWIEDLAGVLIEDVEERFCEEFYQADNYGDSAPFDKESRAAATKSMIEAVKAVVGDVKPYDCEEIAMVMLEAEQVEEMMREHCPEWFEEKVDGPFHRPDAPADLKVAKFS